MSDPDLELCEAAANGDTALCMELIDGGACMSASDELGWTALDHAAINGRAH